MNAYNISIHQLHSTTSTNDYLLQMTIPPKDEIVVAVAKYQSAGRGQGSNTWESEAGKNLLCSILTAKPTVPAAEQFVLSMAGALALKATLDAYCNDITLKWPNDIYWRDRKISGTLIETTLRGKSIERYVYGIGLNINQQVFRSNAPNPVSLRNIIGHDTPPDEVLQSLLKHFAHYYTLATKGKGASIAQQYNAALYRRTGWHKYADADTGKVFMAQINHVDSHGMLHLDTADGMQRTYTLKQVRFVLTEQQ